MKVNVNNVLEKDEKPSELDARASELLKNTNMQKNTNSHEYAYFYLAELKEDAAQFEEISGNLRRKAWKKNRNVNTYLHTF